MRKHSVAIAGHRTSLSLNRLIEEIDRARADDGASGNLSSAVRVFVLDEARAGRA